MPCTRQEGDQILQLTEPGQTTAAFDFDANQSWVPNASLNQYRIVHFATHGWINDEKPALSTLVLSQFKSQGQPTNDDGWLNLEEIFNLKLSADLVVLSACQTGQGREVRGEGIMGLTRGFMYAGAKRLVVSLWNVSVAIHG